ncbi:MAG: hypothetical protein H7840_02655 [Alphaproteobacteria bacterium]
MTDHIQIGDVSPRVQYVANGSQTVFPYAFPIFATGDIQVYLGSTLQASGFSVSGAGTSDGGNVTFTSAPAASTIVTLRRSIAIKRTTDFQEGGAFRAKVVNDELDYQTAAIQQIADDAARAIRRSPTSGSLADLTLPEPVANRALRWNANGNGLANGVADIDAVAAETQASATAAAASASSAAASATTSSTQAATATTQAGIATTQATTATTQATNAATSASNAATSASSAQTYAAALHGTSTTSLAIGTGAKSFTTQTSKQFAAGQFVLAVDAASSANWMWGQVTSYSGASLVIDAQTTGGSGTIADWTLAVSGTRGAVGPQGPTGPQGIQGPTGPGTGDMLASNNLNDLASAVTAFGNIKQAATTTSTGVVELATSAETITGTDTDRAVTPAGLHAKTASETAIGLVELATTAEATTGTDTARAVTPAGVAAAIAAASSSTWVFIQTQTASNVASLDFTTGINSTYECYCLRFDNIRPASADILFGRVYCNGSWQASSYASSGYGGLGGGGIQGAVDTTGACLSRDNQTSVASTTSSGGVSGFLYIFNPAETAMHKHMMYDACRFGGSNADRLLGASMYTGGTQAVTGLRLLFESVNIASGRATLYGLKHS